MYMYIYFRSINMQIYQLAKSISLMIQLADLKEVNRNESLFPLCSSEIEISKFPHLKEIECSINLEMGVA